MQENEPTNPEVEVETPVEEVESDQPDTADGPARDEKGRFAPKGEEADAEEVELETVEEPEEEVEEIDYDGKRYAVPKPIKTAIMLHSDYTKKTQEIAEQRKQYEAAVAQHQQSVEAQKAEFEEYATLHALNKYLEQFRATDWAKAMDEDAIAANQKWMEFQTLKDQYNERNSKLLAKQQERALQTQREIAKREEEGRDALRREIKGWTPETESALRTYAKGIGVPNADNLQFAMHPQETKVLHKAYLYDQLMKKAQQKPKAPEPKPVKTVGQGNRTNPNRLDDDLDADEWLKRRNAQVLRKT